MFMLEHVVSEGVCPCLHGDCLLIAWYLALQQGVWWNPFALSLWFPVAHHAFTPPQFLRLRKPPTKLWTSPKGNGGPIQTSLGTHLPSPAVCCLCAARLFPLQRISSAFSLSGGLYACCSFPQSRHVARGFREVRQSRRDQHGTHVV